LSKASAADFFGLQKAKWDELTSEERRSMPLTDPALAMLLYTYQHHPEASPVEPQPDVKEFYEQLGLRDIPQDRDRFATLIGRSPPSIYRFLLHDGKPGRPVIRWIEAVRRMNLNANKSLRFMSEIASTVGEMQGVKQVLVRGWSKQDEAEHD
jgi:hypothetical protein